MTDRPRLGIIAGSSFLDDVTLPRGKARTIFTPYGDVPVRETADWVILRRHGEAGYRLPHRIPHHAHVTAFQRLGVAAVAGFASTGALRSDIQPADIIVPDDYMSWHAPPTFADDEYLHIVPALSASVRDLLLRAARTATDNFQDTVGDRRPTVRDGGVYVQTHGPRFESAAEVRMLAGHADVVGMTAASEATLFQERGIPYAVLCIVDNMANGAGPTPLTERAYQDQLARNALRAGAIITALVELWTTS